MGRSLLIAASVAAIAALFAASMLSPALRETDLSHLVFPLRAQP